MINERKYYIADAFTDETMRNTAFETNFSEADFVRYVFSPPVVGSAVT